MLINVFIMKKAAIATNWLLMFRKEKTESYPKKKNTTFARAISAKTAMVPSTQWNFDTQSVFSFFYKNKKPHSGYLNKLSLFVRKVHPSIVLNKLAQ